MPKFPTDNEQNLLRYIKGEAWVGLHFCDNREQNKELAKFLRSNGVDARAIILGDTHGMNYGMQAPERYVVYIRRSMNNDTAHRLLYQFVTK